MRTPGGRRNRATKTIARVLLAAVLACGAGCTTPPDWIERTLVTVDVSGRWHGIAPGSRRVPELWLDLQQEGPKAKGSMRALGAAGFTSAPIEGTIAGDVFSFRQTDGPGRGS
jgi:hypothetical protein